MVSLTYRTLNTPNFDQFEQLEVCLKLILETKFSNLKHFEQFEKNLVDINSIDTIINITYSF